jgi:mRNA interferase RelE/StbE
VSYEIQIAPAAERAIGKLPTRVQAAVLDKLEELAEDPRPASCEKVKELAQYGVYRIMVGRDHRIVYQVKDEVARILVVKVADRKEVYRRLDDLKRLLK